MLTIITLATALWSNVRAQAPSVDTSLGTILGTTSNVLQPRRYNASQQVEHFLGIPFAEPPINNLRLRKPQPVTTSFGTLTATAIPTACFQGFSAPQFSLIPDPILAELNSSAQIAEFYNTSYVTEESLSTNVTEQYPEGEDCLVLNVQRPARTAPDAKLPVLLFIHGGDFQEGSIRTFDGTPIVERSIHLGNEIIYVAIQYRLGPFGFLGGAELQEDNSTNLGLRDQRLAIEWVADNIEAFGGDPEKVTLWGQTAGSWSVFDHLLINGGNHTYRGRPLFRNAIMSSGMALPATNVSSRDAQRVFDRTLEYTFCTSATDKLECLREADPFTLSASTFQEDGILSYNSLNLPYLPRPDPTDAFFSGNPYTALEQGLFAKVPIIATNQEDEGTSFALFSSNLTTTNRLIDYFQDWFPTARRTVISSFVSSYPDSDAAGSPFRTGPANNYTRQYKRLAAIIGDYGFTLARRACLRLMLRQLSPSIPIYSGLSSISYSTPVYGTPTGLDLFTLFGLYGTNFSREIFPAQLIAFVAHDDPNALNNATRLANTSMQMTLQWPRYGNASNFTMLQFNANNNSLINDTFRQTQFTSFITHRDRLLQ